MLRFAVTGHSPRAAVSERVPWYLYECLTVSKRSLKQISKFCSIQRPSADLHEYSPSVEWELIGIPAEFHSVKYACCDQPFDDVTYNVRIKRRPLYYTMYLIIPCAMISILTLLVFLLPPDCNERMTVGKAEI